MPVTLYKKGLKGPMATKDKPKGPLKQYKEEKPKASTPIPKKKPTPPAKKDSVVPLPKKKPIRDSKTQVPTPKPKPKKKPISDSKTQVPTPKPKKKSAPSANLPKFQSGTQVSPDDLMNRPSQQGSMPKNRNILPKFQKGTEVSPDDIMNRPINNKKRSKDPKKPPKGLTAQQEYEALRNSRGRSEQSSLTRKAINQYGIDPNQPWYKRNSQVTSERKMKALGAVTSRGRPKYFIQKTMR